MSKLIKYQPLISLSLLTILNSGAILGVTTTLIAPKIALAAIPQVAVSLSRQPKETYPEFLSRAESLATTTIQNRFKKDKSLSDLRVVVVGENQGAIVPILTATISRQRWIIDPNIQAWATYFVNTQLLLGFDQQTAKPQPESAASPPPSPNASQPGGETKKTNASPPPKKSAETPKKSPSPPPNDELPPPQPKTPKPDDRLQTPAKTQENN